MDLLRDIVYKGKNKNPNGLIELKAKTLSPPRAAKTTDVDRVLTEWKHVRRQIFEEDPNNKMDDETLQTLLMKIIPNDFVKSMRELLTQGRYINDYHGFEEALFDEISTRKMDEDARKGSPGIHAIGNTTERQEQENASPQLYRNDIEYETVQIWSEERQRHISGLAPRERDRSRSRSSGRDEEEHSMEKGPSDEFRRRLQRSRASRRSMLDVRRTSLPERMLSCVNRKKQFLYHHSVVIVETRHISRTIGSPMELVASETQGEGERQRQKTKEAKET